MAVLARDEEAWWQAEMGRLGPQMVMAGKPVRGGGRAASEGIALDVTRFAPLAPAMQRRLLRYAAEQLGATLDFRSTEALRELALDGRAGQKGEVAQGLRAERTPRELRLTAPPVAAAGKTGAGKAETTELPEFSVAVPGEVVAAAFGIRLGIEVTGGDAGDGRVGRLRNWKAGDRVRLRYSSGPRKVKEVLERLRVTGSGRTLWPVLELDGRIVWMKGAELEPEAGIRVVSTPLEEEDG